MESVTNLFSNSESLFDLVEMVFILLVPGVLGVIAFMSIGCRLVYRPIDLNEYKTEMLLLVSLTVLSIVGNVMFLCFRFPYFAYLSEPLLLTVSSVISYHMWKE